MLCAPIVRHCFLLMWLSKQSEKIKTNPSDLRWLMQLVKKGEGIQLEFKAKANHPDKIAKELIAFANTKGGTLLIGVHDDGTLGGVQYPEEDITSVARALAKYCRPSIKTKHRIIRLNEKKWVVVCEVRENKRKPVKFLEGKKNPISYLRSADKTIQGTKEAERILEIMASAKPNKFSYGEDENKLLKILEQKKTASLMELIRGTGIPEARVSPILAHLVAARVIGWHAYEHHDLFTATA
jgi:predicted HTH transcriptional regulator